MGMGFRYDVHITLPGSIFSVRRAPAHTHTSNEQPLKLFLRLGIGFKMISFSRRAPLFWHVTVDGSVFFSVGPRGKADVPLRCPTSFKPPPPYRPGRDHCCSRPAAVMLRKLTPLYTGAIKVKWLAHTHTRTHTRTAQFSFPVTFFFFVLFSGKSVECCRCARPRPPSHP